MAAPNDDASRRADDPHRETASIDIEDAGGTSAPASLAVTLSMPMGGTLMRFLARVRDAEGEATGEVLRSATFPRPRSLPDEVIPREQWSPGMTTALDDFVRELECTGWTLTRYGELPWQLQATRRATRTPIWAVPRPARRITRCWRALSTAARADRFDPAMTVALPLTARRWLTHAISDGTVLSSSARLRMRGEIRLGRWRSFHAEEVLAPGRGFVWAATTSMFGLPISGYDRLSDGDGEMRWRLGGLVPVMSTRGHDVSRSAAGRLIGESALVPTAFRSATWSSATPDAVDMNWVITGGHQGAATLTVAADGTLSEVRMQRWGNPFGDGFADHLFVVELGDERSFGGITIPTTMSARWEDDSSINEFFHAEIIDANYG